jgi:hypothetical protein
MKIQAAVVLAAILILTTLVAESEFMIPIGKIPGKRESQEKLKHLLIKLYVLVSSKT